MRCVPIGGRGVTTLDATPDDARPGILVDELTWHPTGASAPLVVEPASYFATVLQRTAASHSAD